MRVLEGPAARMASAERSAHLQDDQDAPLSPREEEAHTHWSGLTPALQVLQPLKNYAVQCSVTL